MIKKHLLVLCAFGAAFMMSGCGNEPNDIAYVAALGFDKAQNGYNITIQYARPDDISGGSSEEGGSGKKIVENLTVEAPDMYSAINLSNNILSKTLSLSHTKIVVFSAEAAADGIIDTVSTVIRSEEIRPNVFAAIAQDSAADYLNSIKPAIEINPAKYYRLIYKDSYSYGIPKTNLQNFYFDEKLKNKNAVLPLVKQVSSGESGDDSESDKPKKNEANAEAKVNESGFEYKMRNYIAGQTTVSGNVSSEAMGMVVFDEGKPAAFMGSVESEIYNLLMGNIKNDYVSFRSGTGDKAVTVKLNGMKKPAYKVDIENKTIDVRLEIDSDLYSVWDTFDSDRDLEDLEKNIKRDIEDDCERFIINTRDEYGCDPIGFKLRLKKGFLTNAEFDSYNFSEDFKNYSVNVDADFKIRRTGMKY